MFENVVSLGFFCGVSMELERIGLRNASYPFDWLISSWFGVEKMIDTNFKGFLKADNLHQYETSREKYRNVEMGISFFHDFDKYTPLEKQLESVQHKYDRRITRFFEDIKKPTLFIRYVESEDELNFWREEYDSVQNKLSSYNKENQVWLIQVFDESYKSETIFFVEPDENDYIARHLFLEKIPELKERLLSDELYNSEKREKNLQVYNKKQKEKNSLKNKIGRKIQVKKEQFSVNKQYIHGKIYNE